MEFVGNLIGFQQQQRCYFWSKRPANNKNKKNKAVSYKPTGIMQCPTSQQDYNAEPLEIPFWWRPFGGGLLAEACAPKYYYEDFCRGRARNRDSFCSSSMESGLPYYYITTRNPILLRGIGVRDDGIGAPRWKLVFWSLYPFP